ncbi:MAG: WD40 repeat domain-containing protein, partial [Pirellulaceae bacterium]
LAKMPMRVAAAVAAEATPAPDYVRDVVPLFTKYCTGCHNEQDREGKLSLDTFAALQRGGEHGAAVLPGQPESSRLIRLLSGAAEPRMPPEGEAMPTPAEIEVLKAWIAAGAKGPEGVEPSRRQLLAPQLPAASGAADRILALAYSPDGKLLAVGRFGLVEIRDVATDGVLSTLRDLPGKVNSLHFSQDGTRLVAATGITGLLGTATVWNVASGQRLLELEGHRDILYDAEFSPDGRWIATCSYDRKVMLWDASNGQSRTFEGHNDAVYDLAFSPDGTVLASASGDKTVKLWHVATGERLDTLSQPQGEQYAVVFSPDGRYVLSGGADNRIRVWEFVSRASPQINPLVHARFGHEGAVLALAFSPDGHWLLSAAEDRTVKLWETRQYTQVRLFDRQSDHVVDLAVQPSAARVAVARLDGTMSHYPLAAEPLPLTSVTRAVESRDDTVTGRPSVTVEEQEPNDRVSDAPRLAVPFQVRGRIDAAGQANSDADVFRFAARAGETWMVEVNAARQKSPLDSKVEVLDAHGDPLPRVVLQAVRDSYFTFRGKDFDVSDDFRVFNWQEMEINEFLYANGEVVKLWHYPRGPDSGFLVYPGRGRRWTWFDTTPISHPLGEPCYIVEPRAPHESAIPNGLPAFTVFFENDDDSWRQWGSDSRLAFTAPADGEYLVRVTDARGFEGDDYVYDLMVRSPKPDFEVRLEGLNPKVGAGGGREFSVQVERLDAFEGEIRVDVEGLPPGFSSSAPIVVQAGQTQALGTIFASSDAPQPTAEQRKNSRVFASAVVAGQMVRKEIGSMGEIQLIDKPKVLVRLYPDRQTPAPDAASGVAPGEGDSAPVLSRPLELTIAPGQTITARVKVERNGFAERIPFGNFDAGRNLPHGVFVDNIGLNGLMIVEGQDERVFFITAAKWVPEQSRMFHLQAQVDGNQASWPVLLHVRRSAALADN